MNMKKISLILMLFLLILFYSSPTKTSAAPSFEDPTASIKELAEKYERYTEISDEKVTLEEFFGVSDESGYAEQESAGEETDMLLDFWNSLPKEAAEELQLEPGDITNGDDISKSFGINFFIEKIRNAVSGIFKPMCQTLSVTLGAILFAAVMRKVSETSERGCGDVMSAVICAAVCLSVFKTGLLNIDSIKSFLKMISNLSNAILPAMTAILVSSGNVSAAAVNAGSMNLFCAVIEFLFSRVTMPLAAAAMALAVVGCVFSEKNSFSLAAFIKRFSIFVTTASMTVLTFVLAVQSSLARSADTVGVRTVKFVIGSFVPIVGGAVSETVNTVGAGIGYIKNTCGLLAVILIFVLMLPPLLSLIFAKFTLSFSSSVSQMLGCDTEAKLFSEIAMSVDCFLALVISTSAVFIIILTEFIMCSSLCAA